MFLPEDIDEARPSDPGLLPQTERLSGSLCSEDPEDGKARNF